MAIICSHFNILLFYCTWSQIDAHGLYKQSNSFKYSLLHVIKHTRQKDTPWRHVYFRFFSCKRKAHEDLDPKENLSQLTHDCPSSMPSHISLGAPVTRKTVNDLTPTFLADAKVEVKRPSFIRWFIATFSYQVSFGHHLSSY